MKSNVSTFSGHSQADHFQFELTYVEFEQIVKERRLAELEKTNPGEDKRNANIAGNMTRALRAFMKANNLIPTDSIGEELLNQTAWEKAQGRLGSQKASQKSLAGKARVWALEAFNAKKSINDEETFGERLARLRSFQGLNYKELALAISNASRRVDWSVLRNWEVGARRPAPQSTEIIQRLERILQAAPGTLVAKMPKVPKSARSIKADLPRSVKRRVSQHVPEDFDSRSAIKQEEILTWVAENILSTSKEILGDGSISTENSQDVFFFALSRKPDRRTKMASPKLLSELDDLGRYKTALIPPLGMRHNDRWGPATKEKIDYDLRAFFGALDLMGLPPEAQSLSLLLIPEAIERFISWRYERRGAYTTTLTNLLQMIASFLNPEFGYLTQKPDFGQRLVEIPGFVGPDTARLARTDWTAACAKSIPRGH